jgi:hemerythrin-like domain-containing protein
MKIGSTERKTIEDRAIGLYKAKIAYEVNAEIRDKAKGYIDELERHIEMDREQTKAYRIWQEGFKAGYAEGYAIGRIE